MYDENNKESLALDKTKQDQQVKLDTLRRIYQQADRVLTQDPVQVFIVGDSGKPPGWSDGESVYINAHHIEDFDIESITEITSLNYHELTHLLYTPRKGSDMVKWVIEQNIINRNDLYLQAFNILEDQRAETLFVSRYPSVGPFLTKGVTRWLAGSAETLAINYLVVRGRRYLPVELRTLFRDEFFDKSLLPSIVDIVDQYRLLAFPRDYAKARELITRFVEEVLLKLPLPSLPPQGGCTLRDPIAKGKPEPGKAQNKDAERAAGMGTKEPTFVVKPKEQPESSDDAVTESSNTNKGGTNATDAEIDPTEVDKPKVKDGYSMTYGAGHSASTGKLPDNVAETLAKIDAEIGSMKEVIQDSRSKQRVIVGGDDKYTDVIKHGKYSPMNATLAAISAARKFARELRMIRRASEPGWERETSSGKININRVIRGCELDEAFDRWDEGDNRTDLEAVILVDRSGSMTADNNDVRASEAIWALKVALQEIDCPTTVYAFDDKPELVFARDEKANKMSIPYVNGDGGTNPTHTLSSAERVLLSSKSSKKLMIIITDGEYNSSSDNIIQRLNSRNVLTVMMLIEGDQETIDSIYGNSERLKRVTHCCKIFGIVKNASDLLPFAKKIVVEMMKPN